MFQGTYGYMAVIVPLAFATGTVLLPYPALAASLAILGFSLGLSAEGRLRFAKLAYFITVALMPISNFTILGSAVVNGQPLDVHVTKVCGGLSLIYLIWHKVVFKESFARTRQNISVLCFAGAIVLSFLLNDTTPSTMFAFRRYVTVLVACFLTVNLIETEKDVRAFMVVFVGGYVLSCLFGLTGLSPTPTTAVEASVFGGSRNTVVPVFAMGCSVSAVFCLYNAVTARNTVWKFVAGGAALLLMYGVATAYARSSYVVLPVALVYTAIKLRKRISPLAAVGFFSVVFVLAFMILDLQRLLIRVGEVAVSPALDISYLRRVSYLRVGVRLFMRDPLFGIGPGNFPVWFGAEEFRYIAADSVNLTTRLLHNMYAGFLVELGLLGFLCFIPIAWLSLRDFRFVQKSFPADDDSFLKHAAGMVEVALGMLLIAAFMLSSEYESVLWIILGLGPALANMRRTQMTKEKRDTVDGGPVLPTGALSSRVPDAGR